MASDVPTLARVVGGTEENWVKSTAGGTGICVFGALFNKTIDPKHLSAVVQELLECHPILRVHIVENSKGKTCFQVSESCSAADYIHEKPWPAVEESDHSGIILFPKDHQDKHGSLALHKLVTEELNVSFVNSEGKPSLPLRVFRVVVHHSHGKHQTVVLLKLHSGALDRLSAGSVAGEFLSKLAAEGRLQPSCSAKKDAGLLAPIEDYIPKSKASKGLLQRGVDAAAYAYYQTKYALLPFDPAFDSADKTPFRSNFVSANLGKQGTSLFFEACKRENVSWAAALAAALLKTAASLAELKEKKQDEFSFTVVKDCRPYLEPKLSATALGYYTLGIPRGEKVKEGIEFWDLAKQVNSSVEKDLSKSKQFSELSVLRMLFSQVLKRPNLTPKSSLRTVLFNVFVDPPMGGQSEGASELDLVGTIGPLSSMHFVGPCFCVMESMMEGPELAVSLVYPSPVFSHTQILELLQSSINILLGSCSHS